MYFWRVYRLAEEFRRGAITERRQIPYLLVYLSLTYLLMDPYIVTWMDYPDSNELDALLCVLCLGIAIVGTLWCYKTSQRRPEANGFLPRYLCLGFPVGVRIAVVSILLLVAFGVLDDFVVPIPLIETYLEEDATNWFGVAIMFVWEVVFFVHLNDAIEKSYA